MSIGIGAGALRALKALRARIGGEAGVEPGAPPAHQWLRIESRLSQLARHTGARFFLGSGAVHDERAAALEAELLRRSHGVVRWHSNRATGNAVVLLPRAVGTGVDELKRLAGREARTEVIDRDGLTED